VKWYQETIVTNNKDRKSDQYFVMRKLICPECTGSGFLPLSLIIQLKKNKTELLPIEDQVISNYVTASNDAYDICLICDGSGFIKNDVPLREALIETMKELRGEEK
jgi:hypothetical protein